MSREGFREDQGASWDALQLPICRTGAVWTYAMCSLFTHHFKDDQVVTILGELGRRRAPAHLRD